MFTQINNCTWLHTVQYFMSNSRNLKLHYRYSKLASVVLMRIVKK